MAAIVVKTATEVGVRAIQDHKVIEWNVKTATEVGVRAIQDHKVIEWNTCWKCRLSEGTDDM